MKKDTDTFAAKAKNIALVAITRYRRKKYHVHVAQQNTDGTDKKLIRV